MEEKEKQEAEREARRQRSAHPERGGRHVEAISRYLGSVAYVEKRHSSSEETSHRPVPGPPADDESDHDRSGPDRPAGDESR